MFNHIGIQIISVILFCFDDSSSQNNVYDIFKNQLQIHKRSIDAKACHSYADCEPTECCQGVHHRSSSGVCMERPALGDECGVSASRLSCPCIAGTTCSRQPAKKHSSRKYSFRCKYVHYEQEEESEL